MGGYALRCKVMFLGCPMTHTIARLILAMLLLPATGAVFVVLFVTLVAGGGGGGPPSVGRLLLFWSVVYAFIAAYWLLLWRGVVRWTRRRVGLTLAGSVAALAAGAALGAVASALNRQIPPPIAVMIGGGGVPIAWVLLTVLVWRETPRERLERLAALGGPAVACPICGYSLAGLYEPRCPECGSRFTLDQLVAAQPGHERARAEV